MKRKQARGFSVIELLVTVGVMAMILAITIGVSRQVARKAEMDAIMNQFVADLAYARQLAARLNRHVAFDFAQNGASYSILVQRKIADTVTFDLDEERNPLDGNQFFESAVDFSINSMGIVKKYPLETNGQPISVIVDFLMIPRGKSAADMEWRRQVKIYPSGGYRVGPKIE